MISVICRYIGIGRAVLVNHYLFVRLVMCRVPKSRFRVSEVESRSGPGNDIHHPVICLRVPAAPGSVIVQFLNFCANFYFFSKNLAPKNVIIRELRNFWGGYFILAEQSLTQNEPEMLYIGQDLMRNKDRKAPGRWGLPSIFLLIFGGKRHIQQPAENGDVATVHGSFYLKTINSTFEKKTLWYYEFLVNKVFRYILLHQSR